MNIVDPDVAAARARGWLVAFDPGFLHPAIAVFRDGVLVYASRVKVPGALSKIADDGERARQIAALVVWTVLEKTGGARPDLLVVEKPKVYAHGKSKGDPANLIQLALVAGAVAGMLCVRVYSPIPFEWIGNIPKTTKGDAWSSPRGMLFRRRLTDVELLAIVVSHDALDSVGIGLHALGRLGKTYSTT